MLLLLLLNRPQLIGHEPGFCDTLADHIDHGGDIDAHRANHAAAPAFGAGVIHEFLPLFQFLRGDVMRE